MIKIEAFHRLTAAQANVKKTISFFSHYGIYVSVLPKKVPLGKGKEGMIVMQLDTDLDTTLQNLTKHLGKPKRYKDSMANTFVWITKHGSIHVHQSKEKNIPNTVALTDNPA